MLAQVDFSPSLRPGEKSRLAPVKALSKIFRAKVRDAVKAALPDAAIADAAWKQKWCVHCKPAPGATDAVLRYVARYVYRGIISNRDIISVTDTHVTFRYKATDTGRLTTMTLHPHEFMRRLLQHVLPKGFHRVRTMASGARLRVGSFGDCNSPSGDGSPRSTTSPRMTTRPRRDTRSTANRVPTAAKAG